MSFRPLSLPLAQGLAQDVSAHALSMPDGMQSMQNVAFTRKGAITGRPGLALSLTAAQTGPGSAVTTLAAATAGLTPAGIVPVNASEEERPLAMWQGGQYVHTGSIWRWAGTVTFARKHVSQALGVDLLLRGTGGSGGHVSPVPVGTSVVGRVAPGTISANGISFLSASNELLYRGTATVTNIDGAGQANMAAAGNALFYHNSAGDVRIHLSSAPPTTSDLLIAAAVARTDTAPRMNVSAVVDTVNGGYFLAWVSATAGRISLRRINAAGAVAATLDVNGLGTLYGVHIALSTAGRLIMGTVDTATATLKTKVFTTTAATITDTGFNLDYDAGFVSTTTPFGVSFTIGISGISTGIVSWLNTSGECAIMERDLTAAATLNTVLGLYGSAGVTWEPLFAPVVLNGRTLMGVLRTNATQDFAAGTDDYNVGQSQWFVLDLTEGLGPSVSTPEARACVVAHGEWRGCARSFPTQAALADSNTLVFGVWEGTSYDVLGTSNVRAVRIALSFTPAAVANGPDGAVLSSANAILFDGVEAMRHPFPETYPDVTGVNAVAGGSLAAGSYSYQATWEVVNARGQVVRSGSSNVVTITGVALNQKVQVAITTPQLWDYKSGVSGVIIKLWATEVTPSAGAPLYLAGATLVTGTGAGEVTIEHAAPVDTTADRLYTVGDVLDDQPPPAGDRGVAFAIERLWVADQERVYASKLLRSGFCVAWNTEGLHTIKVPGALGQIQGLAGYDDRLVVVCSNGVAIIRGAGVDDNGNGPGWATDVYPHHGAGSSHPRRVSAMPEGVVYQGRNGSLWLVDAGGNQQRINAELAATALSISGDVSFLQGTSEDSAVQSVLSPSRLIHGTPSLLAVRDLDVGMWATWHLPAGSYHAPINGVLWVQAATSVLSLTGDLGTDVTASGSSAISMTVVTGMIRPGTESYYGWGRLRKIQLHGPTFNGTAVTVNADVTADDWRPLLSYVGVVTGVSDTLWPVVMYPEMWCDVQRCRHFQVQIVVSPAVVEISSIAFWVADTGTPAPNNNRG